MKYASPHMRDRMKSVLVSWAFIGGSLIVLACGASTPAPPGGEPDAGPSIPDGGTGPEPSVCAVTAPASCPEPAPRYADVEPIFQSRCVVCHKGEEGGPWSLGDYGHVADWQDTIRTHVRDCTMPPEDAGIPMTVAERTAILTWIRCGLPR
jgi:hypothetical protein